MTECLAEVVAYASKSLEVSTELVNICSDAKGTDIEVLRVNKISDISDYFIVVSARSDRHVQGICNKVLHSLHEKGVNPLSVDGLEKGHWVVIDLVDVVLHVFYEPVRSHYDVEGLWARAPRMKIEKQGSDGHIAMRAA